MEIIGGFITILFIFYSITEFIIMNFIVKPLRWIFRTIRRIVTSDDPLYEIYDLIKFAFQFVLLMIGYTIAGLVVYCLVLFGVSYSLEWAVEKKQQNREVTVSSNLQKTENNIRTYQYK